jgi:hypothetical protein
MVMSRDQNARGSHNAKIDNISFERVEELKYLNKTLADQNYIQEEIESRLKLGNACCHSVQKFLSSSLPSKNIKNVLYRTIILPVVLYGCETWSLTLTEECGMRLFENRVRRRIFGPKRNEVTGEWRKLHREELNYLYSSPMIILAIKSRRMRWPEHVARMGRGQVHTGFWGKPEGQRPRGRPRGRCKDNIKMELQEVGWAGMDWIDLARDRDRKRALVNAVMSIRFP